MKRKLSVALFALVAAFTVQPQSIANHTFEAKETVKIEKDSHGKVDYKNYYNNGHRTKYENWSNGHKTQTIKYDSHGKADSKTWYSTSGRKTKFQDWSNGYKVLETKYDSRGKVDSKTHYAHGKRTSFEDWSNGKKLSLTKYASNGKVDRKYFYSNGKKTKYQDWSNGKVVRTIKYSTSGKVTYDSAKKSSSSSSSSKYKTVKVSACNQSGSRVANAKVDIGFDSSYANRKYYAYTNSHKQLVKVTAAKIIPQNDKKEHTTSKGRYCSDEAKVPGTEKADLDEGHVIADSLGGVSNAYNITPQASSVNRSGGAQYNFEQQILKAHGATNFVANIKYPNTSTQTPSSYSISYTINGKKYSKSFSNKHSSTSSSSSHKSSSSSSKDKDYGTCTEARKHVPASSLPYVKGHDPEYYYYRDGDGDGKVCE